MVKNRPANRALTSKTALPVRPPPRALFRPPPTSPNLRAQQGASQNALEYLTGGNDRTDQEGTLTIEDLMNAQGVRNATGAGSQEDPDTTPPDNDGVP